MSDKKLLRYIQSIRFSHQTIKLWCALIILIILMDGFSYYEWSDISTIAGRLKIEHVICAMLLLCVILSKSKSKEHFKTLVIFLLVCPFFSILNSYALYGQPMLDSIIGLIPNIMWLSYFIFNRYCFTEKTLIKVLLYYSAIILLIQVVQQFTYPVAFFGLLSKSVVIDNNLENNVVIRNGVYRFLVHFHGYTIMPVLLFYLGLIKQKITINRLFIFISMLVAIYLSLTRQVIFSCIFVIIISTLMNKNGGISLKYLVTICIVLCVIYSYADILFGELSEKTKEEWNENNIRISTYIFYWDKIRYNIWTFIAGHGFPVTGYFFNQFEHWQKNFRFYTSDVGIIGIWFHYGLLYVLLYIYSLFLFFRYRKQIPSYIILFAIFAGLMSIMIFPFWLKMRYYFIWSIIFYICDLHINKSPLRIVGIKRNN